MSTHLNSFVFRIVAIAGVILIALLTSPSLQAGNALAIVPAEDSDVPAGSYIPEHRIEKIRSKVRDYKATLKQQKDEGPEP